ncbi:MAG: general secretion pathway protein GspK [Bdellovibrionales bacterium]|nr:general secretion pathway protein GspK [Bdellovibrionales bacterium]
MMFFQKRIDRKGVALFIVLASMATLAIFVSEITYTAQINQKLAYDRLDQVKAQALAKSGLRLSLLRIRAYSELKKTIGKISENAGANAAMVNSMVPKEMLEKIWAEPITIPFTGDISSLPGEIKDTLTKFRKDSSMEGKLYISIQAQSNKINLNSTLSSFAANAGPSPSPSRPGSPGQPASPTGDASASASPTPVSYDPEQSRQALGQQIKDTFQRRFEEDEKFRDEYRNFRIEDLVDEMIGWSDLSFESNREQSSTVPFKKAPFYHVSELNYLPSMDDTLFSLLSEQFTAGVASFININTVQEAVLKALLPQMTKEEITKFFEFRDGGGEENKGDNKFRSSDDFYKYLKERVQFFLGSETRITDLKNLLTQRGIRIITEESNFLVHIEATVQQTKKTLEAMVSLIESPTTPPTTQPGIQSPGSNPANPTQPGNQGQPGSERSNLKITQLRFL